jgi:hypothetical protein
MIDFFVRFTISIRFALHHNNGNGSKQASVPLSVSPLDHLLNALGDALHARQPLALPSAPRVGAPSQGGHELDHLPRPPHGPA